MTSPKDSDVFYQLEFAKDDPAYNEFCDVMAKHPDAEAYVVAPDNAADTLIYWLSAVAVNLTKHIANRPGWTLHRTRAELADWDLTPATF